MFFIVISLYFLITIVWCILFIHNIIFWCFLPVLWYSIHMIFRKNSLLNPHLHHSLILLSDTSTIYNQFKHGDIIFTTEYSYYNIGYEIMLYFNYGMGHTSLLVEENGIKYMINARPEDDDTHILQKYTYSGKKWVVLKEPLLDFILKYKCIFNVFRHRKPNSIKWTLRKSPTYCSQVIGTLLYEANMISTSGLLNTYTPDGLIELLYENGYKSFIFKHV
jgi:hypothetical protein